MVTLTQEEFDGDFTLAPPLAHACSPASFRTVAELKTIYCYRKLLMISSWFLLLSVLVPLALAAVPTILPTSARIFYKVKNKRLLP
jgi:hypothetical protein